MKNRVLGKDLEVSAVGLGTMGFTHAYGPAMNDADAIRIIEQSLDYGYTFFDTAQCYLGQHEDGSPAVNEKIVGQALRSHRREVKIASKFGVKHEGRILRMDSRPETIRRSIEESLTNLQTDYLDLYYQHRIDPNVPAEEVAGVMSELIAEGKIFHWGISEANEEYLRAAHKVCPVTCIENRYSMMARWHESLFPVLEELNIGFVAFSPLANGILTDAFKKGETFASSDYRSLMPQYTEEAYEANRELFELIRTYAAEKEATPAQISLAWMLAKKPFIVPIPGSRKLNRLEENAKSAEITLSKAEVMEIDRHLDTIEMSAVFGGSPVGK
jgi:aryl-alcohol dehydrogenase-like predicted oxidoreductase